MNTNFVCGDEACTACGACIDSCPFDALELKEGDLGELELQIDMGRCRRCGVCHRVCPSLHPISLSMPIETYAAWSNERRDVELSSSGGVAAALSRLFMSFGGIVFSTVVEHGVARCVEVSSPDGLEGMRGSKYVYSSPKGCYRKIKNYLKRDERVLFISTPCQVAALRSVLNGMTDGLLCVDLICHGTPSPALLNGHFSEKDVVQWDSFSFRGERDFRLCAYNGREVVYERTCFEDEYFAAFVMGIIHRNACYECPYSRNERVGDLTIGDFWGLDKDSLKSAPPGKVSLVLANTSFGLKALKGLRDDLYLERRSFAEADNKEQTNLHEPSAWTRDRDRFLKKYRTRGFDAAVHTTGIWKRFWLRSVMHKLLSLLK